MRNLKFKQGFTIAEIAIALVILGAISFILMPVITHNTQQQTLSTSLVHTYAQLKEVERAVTVMQARGQISPHATAITAFMNAAFTNLKTIPSAKFNSALRMSDGTEYQTLTGDSLTRFAGGNAVPAENEAIILKNTVFIAVPADGSECGSDNDDYNLAVDVNGKRRPNAEGSDIFYFNVARDASGTVIVTPVCEAQAQLNQ